MRHVVLPPERSEASFHRVIPEAEKFAELRKMDIAVFRNDEGFYFAREYTWIEPQFLDRVRYVILYRPKLDL